tara:strand:+ start:143 stop:667 length:525 start_codon:yes stop_codon:yes gene_type:complete
MRIKTILSSKFTGIIQLAIQDESGLRDLQDRIVELYSDQQPVPKLHVTLLHQSYPKKITSKDGLRGDKALKTLFKSGEQMAIELPSLQLDDVKIGFDLTKDRRSTYIEVKNSEACIVARNLILKAAGIDPVSIVLEEPEASRVFHISLTNLDGNGGASIAYPQAGDKLIKEIVA